MSNPQIEPIKKCLAGPESVSAEALERAADWAYARAAADCAAAAYYADAKAWAEKYEELTK